jgi:hypothetical protein
MAANSSAGRVPLVIWAATVDPAEVPIIRSAEVASTPASDRPAMRPICHALPAAPPPARTKARLPAPPAGLMASACWLGLGQLPCPGVPAAAMPSEVGVELMCGVGEGVVFTGVAFRGCLSGAPSRDYLSRAIMPCGGAPITDTAFMGSHLLPVDHGRPEVSTPATRCAAGRSGRPGRAGARRNCRQPALEQTCQIATARENADG